MSNMGYCRFRNTLPDLSNCLDSLSRRDALSAEELTAAKHLLKTMVNFLLDEKVVATTDSDYIDNILFDCSDGADEYGEEDS